MTIYILERDNPHCHPEPEVFLDGESAFKIAKKEFEEQLLAFGTSLEECERGEGCFGCYWNFYGNTGSALIDSDYDGDRWEWRVTEHVIGGEK